MKLRIDHIAVEIADETKAEEAKDAIRQALALLAARIAATGARPRTVAELELTPDSLTAAGLADALYRELR
jgi:hypothetical protein